MGCIFTISHPPSNGDPGVAAPEPGTGQGHGGPHLVVSNCPETIALRQNPAVLYRAEVPLSGATNFRVYVWHVNDTGAARTFRVRLKLTSGTLTVSNRKFSEDVISANADLLELGRELACVYKYGNFDNVPGGTFPVSTSFVELWSEPTNDGQLVGCVYEFSISAPTSDVSLIIQTSCDSGTPAADVPPVAAPVNTQLGHIHIRGWWPYSEIEFPVGGYLEADPMDPGDPIICAVVEKLDGEPPPQGEMPPELAPTAFGPQFTADEFGTNQGNKGLYGATVRYKFQAINSNSSLPGSLNLDINMRNTGPSAKFSGVGGTVTPAGTMRHIPVLRANTDPRWSAFDADANMSIAPNTTSNNPKVVVCELSTAGAATLPVNLVFSAGTIT